jgi:hypothetical protein
MVPSCLTLASRSKRLNHEEHEEHEESREKTEKSAGLNHAARISIGDLLFLRFFVFSVFLRFSV